jgi:hypothetical protein
LNGYCFLSVLLPLELPEPMPLEPVLGAGVGVGDAGDVLLLPLELPLVPPVAAPEPDLLK